MLPTLSAQGLVYGIAFVSDLDELANQLFGVGRFGHIAAHQAAVAARFQTFGCGPAIAACSLLTEWLQGKGVEEARALSPEMLVEMLGGLPEDKHFCAGLAVTALQDALSGLP